MTLRLIEDGPARGDWNMAVDEALLQGAAAPDAPAALRFYEWEPACLSIGRFQKQSEISAVSAVVREGEAGRDWVRRPTGGRAVWHDREITYSFAVRADLLPPEAQSVAGAYRYLSEAFIVGLATLGIKAMLAPAETKEQRDLALRTANCFASATRSDFVVEGRKLIGAAQCRRNGAILQHGSLLLDTDEAAWRRAVGETGRDATEGMISLRSLGVHQPCAAIIEALCGGVQQVLGMEPTPQILNAEETALAKGLQVKYGSRNWNWNGIEPITGFVATQSHGGTV